MPRRTTLLMLPSDVVELLALWIARCADDPMRDLCALDASSTEIVPPNDAWQLAARRTLSARLYPNVVWESVVRGLGKSACKALIRRLHKRSTSTELIRLVDAVMRDAADEVVQMVRDVPACVFQTQWPTIPSATHWTRQSYMFKIGGVFGVALVEVPDEASGALNAFASIEWCAYVGVNQDPVTALKLPEFVRLACTGIGWHGESFAPHARRPITVRGLFEAQSASSTEGGRSSSDSEETSA